MSTVPADLSGKSDAELIAQVRGGTIAAYGTLYERHSGAAHNLARQLARSSSEADDLVSEAFSKVLDTLRAGKGPDAAFRAYLLTALRHTAYDKTRKDKRVDLNEDMTDAGGAVGEALTVPFADTAVAGLERTMAAKAFSRLPERWQAVLWHTEIEQQSPAEVAPLLGLTANGVSALAYRAREGLRQAYLQVHLQENNTENCRAAADRLGAWTRDGLSKRERSQVENHLDECENCRSLAAELADINGGLRGIIAPIVLGGAALGYLATAGAAKASAATVAVAAASSSGAAGAAAAGPRQFAGVAASGVAIAAAIAVALAAGGGSQDIPAAAAPPPAVVQPVKPVPPPVVPPPVVQPQPVVPPPVVPPPASPAAPPVVPPVTPAPPPTTPVTPAPPPPDVSAPPKVTATAPTNGIELQPGSAPAKLPLTVRNDGGTVSEPVVAALKLPPGVTAVPAGGGGTLEGARLEQGAPPMAVNCPGGEGTVTCKTGSGLQPGQSAVLNFLLQADDTAQPGSTVTGSVTAGVKVNVSVSVKVTVKPPPDAVVLQAETDGLSSFPWTHNPLVYVRVSNTGKTTKPVSVTFDHPLWQSWSLTGFPCRPTAEGATCTTRGSVAPGNHVNLWVRLKGRPAGDGPVSVAAKLGTASAGPLDVYFGCWLWSCREHQSLVPTPTTPTTSDPATSTGKSTTPPKKSSSKTTTAPPASEPDDPPETQGKQPVTTTSAPPPPGPGKGTTPGKQPPSVTPRGWFGWLTE
ncbi:sigma-70 family RNA polymerase sigma factor [Amycolatopsis sp. H20-H5]|uniref:sigma-70 family RNA polymerase sigma factor n=1 Tax=Amycolatopsis sp. H20-H5 TaxID=3046309 RepID=UPI002DB671D5|nr:sigma-70 family RNA polymerase sigma factor [Amycolatopsis sp. H20-H5]MEC3978085.1 sigma-70 family RNA polymerase sigma factor [Amycolatopsis sp. H20-H5]